MPSSLRFPDAEAASDAIVFAGRAARLGEDAAVRLQASSGALVMSAAVLAPRGLMEATPTVLAMRILPIDPELECDFAVAAASLRSEGTAAVALPETAVTATWAGISPPRGGWRERGALEASVIASRAQWGMAAVSDRVPRDAGEDAVRATRARVWGESDSALDGLPLGSAFAALTMGFIVGDERAQVRESGPWLRLSLSRGHVLTRTTVRSGLTPVRGTGSAR
ncbi:hypothetical protein GCM10009808_06220 [Microbacterium sediminicola]|uniref:Urease accessory protein n=1 Tax=Microbacterium sediminicola TaxID=415210 RepID=A0ABN2HQQ9_9MICO